MIAPIALAALPVTLAGVAYTSALEEVLIHAHRSGEHDTVAVEVVVDAAGGPVMLRAQFCTDESCRGIAVQRISLAEAWSIERNAGGGR